ncbi:MAG: hypothetical protein NVSMB68_16140 [Thermoanaerobaculia bacterium]
MNGYKSTRPESYASLGPIHNVGKGEYLFKSRCAACHTIGKGDRVGPDLLNVTASRDPVWLGRDVAAPDRVLAGGDPIARKLFAKYRSVRMPNLSLSAEDVGALLPYIEQQGRAVASSGITSFNLVLIDAASTPPFLTCTTSTSTTTIDGGTLAVAATTYTAVFKVTETRAGTTTAWAYQDKGKVTISGTTYTFRSPGIGTFTGTLSGGTLTVGNYPYCGATHTLVYQ